MNIAILGGGVGGLSSAIALKMAGFNVEVYERHSAISEIGAGIVCWPNASFVLQKLGVLPQIEQVSGLLESMNRFDSRGDTLGTIDICKLNKLMSYPSYSIIRKDLMKILAERAEQLDIPINYEYVVTEVSNTSCGCLVHFENGDSICPELIIGADGRMNSKARLFVTGDNKPLYQGFVNWIGVYEGEQELFPQCAVADYWGVGERFGIVPVSTTKAYWAGGKVVKNITPMQPEKFKAELLSLFSYWPEPIKKIICETPDAAINKVFVHDHDPIDCWHKDNLLLLGDAAHSPLPTSGQGACQALEDAWHLAKCLSDYGADYKGAFLKFEKQRKSKTSGIIATGRQLAASIFNTDPYYCKQRNKNAKQSDYTSVVAGMAKGWASGLPIAE